MKKHVKQSRSGPAPARVWLDGVAVAGFLRARSGWVSLVLVLIATLRIVSTWTVFNHTADEPAHISCGMEWLSRGVYRYEHQHPPLTRVMVALGPYLLGERTTGHPKMDYDGSAILHRAGHYDAVLASSRAGNLPFFWLACWMAFLWGRRIYGRVGAVLAVFVFTFTPLVLAHAGLSTTDMGLTALFAASLYCLVRCLEAPGWRTAVLLGLSLGGMSLSKFSGFAFLPPAVAAGILCWFLFERKRASGFAVFPYRGAAAMALSVPLTLLVVWAGYRFSFGRCSWFPFAVPFPELFSGVSEVSAHNAGGHLSFLLGSLSMQGFLLFFPVLIAVKTPISVLAAAGCGFCLKGPKDPEGSHRTWPRWMAWAAFSGVLLVAMSAKINIGLRHMLPAFVFVAVIAAGGLWALLNGEGRRWAFPVFGALTLWLAVTGVAAHPDYLSYFNAFAGDHPENIVVDSDLDWGQDMKRLGTRLRELNAPFVTFTNHVAASLDGFGFPPRQHSDPLQPSPGWNAVSLTELKLYRMGLQLTNSGAKPWPEGLKPAGRVGDTILLFYFRPQ